MECYLPKIETKINFAKPYYFLGEDITGNIIINLNSETQIISIELKINLDEYWEEKQGSSTKSYSVNNNNIFQNYLDLTKIKQVKSMGGKIFFRKGDTRVDFNINFTANECPSFEYTSPDFKAFIRYTFIVFIHSYKINKSFSCLLCLKSPPYIRPGRTFTQSINQNIKKWIFLNKGEINLKVSIPEDNFKYGSIWRLIIEIDNRKGKMMTKETRITLIRRIKCKIDKDGPEKEKDLKKIIRKKITTPVNAGKFITFECDLKLKEENKKEKDKKKKSA